MADPVHRPSLFVLVVDDFQDAADTTAAVLTLSGHDATAVYSAAEALKRVEDQSYDVILLDIAMPGMDGCEMVERILERPFSKRPFLIALTGCTTEPDRARVAAAGVDLFLAKPVDPAILEGILDRIGRFLETAQA
ncbi:response regulator [Limnoglobus roseus]|uniref:Response regulator n=1 Tax=Limnoglobus roseus TaxID=2598579 RepID=A0A5C1AJS1_9BACT|nr:response regulator [Limnoglobus roseus]QEL18256.1 response regulator [Limnoglobus roseus]